MILPAFYTTDRIFVPTLRILFFILKRTPDEGHPASSHTLCQKFVSLLSSLGPLFQPANLRGVLLIDGMELIFSEI